MAQGRGLAELVAFAAQPSTSITAFTGTIAGVSVSLFTRRSTAHCSALEADQSPWQDNFTLDSSKATLESTSRLDDVWNLPDTSKEYYVQAKAVSSVYSTYNLAFTALRSLAFNFLPLWHEYFQEVERLEEEAFEQGLEPLEEWPPLPKHKARPALERSLWQSLRDLATLTVRRLYEREAVQRCSPRTASKLLKDTRASICRKRRYLLWYTRPLYFTRTYFRANILGSAADCTVSIAIDSYRVIYRPARLSGRHRQPGTIAQRFARICVANALRCSSCLVVASIGAGVGTLLFMPFRKEGVGAFVGASAAEFGFTVFVFAPAMNQWAYGPAPQLGGNPQGGVPPRIEDASNAGGDDGPDSGGGGRQGLSDELAPAG